MSRLVPQYSVFSSGTIQSAPALQRSFLTEDSWSENSSSTGLFEGEVDGIAEGVELRDGALSGPLAVACIVLGGIVVLRVLGTCERVVRGDQDRMAHGKDGFLVPLTDDQAAVLGREIAVFRASGGHGRFRQRTP
ncbi:MAG: hypothetical protein M1118_00995 [Chloroflexi bacterium]|nr:hypothetical protein [Chloroflexota bacterium]